MKINLLEHKKILIGTTAALLIGAIGIPMLLKPSNQSEPVREREYQAKKDNITVGIESSGLINAIPNIHKFEENTVIDEILIKVGSEVKKGDKLGTISLENLKELIQTTKDELSDARATLLQTQSTKDVLLSQNNQNKQDSINQSQQEFTTKIEGLNSEKARIQKSIEDAESKIAELEKEIDTISPQVAEMEAKIFGLKVEINQNIIKIGELNEQLLQLDGSSDEVNTIRLEITKLQNKNTALQQEVDKFLEDDVISKLENLKSERSVMEGELENQYSSLSLKVEEIQRTEKQYDQALKEQNENNTFSDYKTNEEVKSINENIEKANRNVNNAQEKLNKLYELEKNPTLYAQMDGIVTALNYKSGDITVEGKPFCLIGQTNNIRITVPVSAADIGSISNGQKVNIYVDAFAEQKFSGTVVEKLLVANDNGDFEVSISVDPSENVLLPGMKAFATIILKEKNDILTISNKAIFLEDGQQYVNIKKENGESVKTKIVTGFSDGRISEVLDGLSENDVTVVKE